MSSSFAAKSIITLYAKRDVCPAVVPHVMPALGSPTLRVVVQGNANSTAMVSVVLADDLLAVQLPEAGVVVRAGGDEVGRVGAEGAVPDPALVAGQGGLERVGAGPVVLGGGLEVGDFPDLGGVIGAAGGKLLDVGGEEDAGDVLIVGAEVGDGDELGALRRLD